MNQWVELKNWMESKTKNNCAICVMLIFTSYFSPSIILLARGCWICFQVAHLQKKRMHPEKNVLWVKFKNWGRFFHQKKRCNIFTDFNQQNSVAQISSGKVFSYHLIGILPRNKLFLKIKFQQKLLSVVGVRFSYSLVLFFFFLFSPYSVLVPLLRISFEYKSRFSHSVIYMHCFSPLSWHFSTFKVQFSVLFVPFSSSTSCILLCGWMHFVTWEFPTNSICCRC